MGATVGRWRVRSNLPRGRMRIKSGRPRSTPTPQPDNLRYGGNTSCVEVRWATILRLRLRHRASLYWDSSCSATLETSPYASHLCLIFTGTTFKASLFYPLYENPKTVFLFTPPAALHPEAGDGRADGCAISGRYERDEAQRGFYNLEQGRVLDDVMVGHVAQSSSGRMGPLKPKKA